MRQISRPLLTLLMTGIAATALASASSRRVEQPAVAGEAIPQVLRGQEIRPLSLASGDFDGDGVQDLAAGFGTREGGVVVVYRGNVDALYPNSPEARQRRTEGRFVGQPFLPTDRVLPLSAPPEFLAAGDFDADGNADLAAAERGGPAIALLSGDGAGAFRAERRVTLPGGITAFAVDDLDRRDGLPDLVAAVTGPAGSQALILQGPSGALAGPPSSVELPVAAGSIAVGGFSPERRRTVALLGEDGRVRLLRPEGRRGWKLAEADTLEELDAASAGFAVKARAADLPEDAAATLAMRIDTSGTAGEIVLESDGFLSAWAAAVASTFVVDVATDLADAAPGNGICADVNGDCSLRAAIQEANANAGADTISFAIPGAGVPAISTPGLPAITGALTIDGTTQAAGRVMITGTTNGTLITLSADGCVVRGIVLNGTGNFGLRIQSSGNVVEGNYFGTTADGTALQGGIFGPNILVSSGAGNRIGGTAAAARNVLAGGTNGIRMDGGTGTLIQGNYIGTDAAGTAGLGASTVGVRSLTSAVDGTIGGAAPGAGNVISGNAVGIQLDNAGYLIQGNLIGLDANGVGALGNAGIGLHLNFNGDTTVGGTAPGAGNVISGNGSHGIALHQNAPYDIPIQGNLIGTDFQGFYAVPNQGYGIYIFAASEALIGGPASGAGNVISGNLLGGIFITKFSTVFPTANVIQGNLIGTDITGTVAVGNVGSGITFEWALGTIVGGAGFGESNLISGNQEYGIRFDGITDASANPNVVLGNLIGTNVYGTGALGNAQAGVFFPRFVPGYVLGGPAPGESNVIAYNGGPGVGSDPGRKISFRPNLVYSNGGLGVDRGNDGVTPDQPPAGFVFENAPVLTAASTSPAGTAVSGTLASGQAVTFTIHVFASPACDASGYGEARQYLGATTVAATAGVATPFSANLPAPAPAGSYITALAVAPDVSPYLGAASELSFCRQVTGDPGPPPVPPPLSLSVVVPAQGGNGGSVTVVVTGESIDPSATVKLSRAGQPDIPGEFLQVGPDGGNVRAIFNLTGAVPGAWDLVVTNPSSASASLPGGFTVEAGGEADLFADLVGRTRILRGRDTTYYIVFGNRGTVDAYGSNVILAGIPSDATVTPLFEITPIPQYSYLDPFDYTQIPLVAPSPEGQSIQLFVPVVPAGSRIVLAVRIRTSQPAFELRVGIGEPWFVTTGGGIGATLSPRALEDMSPETLNCLMTILKNVASAVLDALIPQDCASLVQSVMANHLPNWFGNMLGAAQAPAGTSSAILASTQASTQILQIGTKGALCFAELLPAAKLFKLVMKMAEIAAAGQAIAEIYDACKDQLPDWLRKPIESLIPSDPNDKIGADGTAAERWVNGVDPARYQILFENKPEATAPAHEVVVTDQLDAAKFDLSTFSFGPVTFGDFVLETPENVPEFTADVDMRPTRNVIVRVSGGLDPVSGQLAWHFFSLDPATGLPSEDPDQGFLPPNTAPPAGEGTVSFVVDLNEGLSSGTDYRNRATIVFDLEAPILTPEWINTIDATAPASQVAPLPGTSCSAFPVQWSGTDAHSGVSNHDVYVSGNGGPWQLWRAHDPGNSAVYEGLAGNTYAFHSVARDAAGNEEPAPGSADASTSAADPSPVIDALDPDTGSAGGAGVNLSGDGFVAGLTLSVGGAPATGVTVTDPTSLSALFPPLAAGTLYDVTATNAGGCGWTFPKAWLADFLDVDGSHPFHRYVESIVRKSVTAGCGGGNYCPAGPVTRAQMAVFLLKSKYGAAYAPPPATGAPFADVPPGSFAADWIEQLATEEITGGCGGGNYCPGASVTRAQMAVFLLKSAKGPNHAPPAAGGVFLDVPPANPFAPWIEELAAEEITGGCGGGNYCPGNPVTRGQMAVFLAKTFGY